MPNAHGEHLLGPMPSTTRRGPVPGQSTKPIQDGKWAYKQHRRRERFVRVEWYLREYGRPPTYDELIALRELQPK